LSSVLDTAAEGIIVIDERARVLMFNKACEWLFGYSAAEMLDTDVRTILPAEWEGLGASLWPSHFL